MSKTFKITLIVTGILFATAFLLLVGFFVGRLGWWAGGFGPGGMMGLRLPFGQGQVAVGSGSDWIYPVGMGSEMMGGYYQGPAGPNGAPHSFPFGGHMGPGMMGGYGGSGYSQADPLSLEQAEGALQDFLSSYGDEDLHVAEIMIFDNHAYAEIVEQSTGIGAMEVLVDPVTLEVYPEHGPNMMWNLKYGMMSGNGMMSGGGGYGMMGGNWWGSQAGSADLSAEMPVSPEQAVEIAQSYLDKELPGAQADEHADPFYGYYTLHILRDGQVTGMLSVNGYNSQVFLHTWHGEFIEMSEEH